MTNDTSKTAELKQMRNRLLYISRILCVKSLTWSKSSAYPYIIKRVTWAPVKSGELWSSVKSGCFAIRFSVARSARNRFYRGKSAQYLTWRFRHHRDAIDTWWWCWLLKIASSRRRHLVLGMFGHVPFWGRSLCWHIVDTWISPMNMPEGRKGRKEKNEKKRGPDFSFLPFLPSGMINPKSRTSCTVGRAK